jgi:hypothetical protein
MLHGRYRHEAAVQAVHVLLPGSGLYLCPAFMSLSVAVHHTHTQHMSPQLKASPVCVFMCVHCVWLVAQVVMVPQLTLLAAGLYPWPVLCSLVEAAVAAAQQALMNKVGH